MTQIDTKVFVVLNEETLNILHKYDEEKNIMVPAVFDSWDDANMYAAERLELWDVLNVRFTHHFINHRPNMSYEKV